MFGFKSYTKSRRDAEYGDFKCVKKREKNCGKSFGPPSI